MMWNNYILALVGKKNTVLQFCQQTDTFGTEQGHQVLESSVMMHQCGTRVFNDWYPSTGYAKQDNQHAPPGWKDWKGIGGGNFTITCPVLDPKATDLHWLEAIP
jgi:hypothetical protein